MAYNNGYPVTYPQMQFSQFPIMQQPQQAVPAQQASGSGLTWVSGEPGAKSYLVSPNSTVPLFDSEAQVIYLKSADASGMPSIKVLDYTIRDVPAANPPGIQQPQNDVAYAMQADVDALKQDIKSIRKDIRKYMITEVDDADE